MKIQKCDLDGKNPRMEEAICDNGKQITDILLDGLVTDGGHHKQFQIEMVLLRLVGETEFKRLKNEFEWDDGIPS